MPAHSKYDPATAAALWEALRGGSSIKGACGKARIGVQTLSDWLSKGERGEEPYAAFALEHAAVMAEVEEDLIRQARADSALVGKSDWKRASWELERRFPKEWGAQLRVLVQQEVDGILEVAAQVLPEDHLRALLEAIASREPGGAAHALPPGAIDVEG